MKYDVIIIGKGPAGISASIYLARAGYSVLVIGKDRGALERAETIENYYGFQEPVTGADLVERGIAQALRFGVYVLSLEVVGLAIEDCFVARTVSEEYRATALLVATGKQRMTLKTPGFEEFRGRGISFCATCDGFFYRNKKVAVIGSGDYAASELAELLHFTKDIILFTNGVSLSTKLLPPEISIVTERIEAFTGTEKLTGITVSSPVQSTYPVDGIFVAVGTAGAADFAAKLGVETSQADIVVDKSFMTNLPGIFAAGDCIGGLLQVAKAVSDGAIAAKGIIGFLKKS
jgi:thioredoxin reductase (NADPH)